MNWHKLDKWTKWHFGLSFIGVIGLVLLGLDPISSGLIAFATGILWEILIDEFHIVQRFKPDNEGCYTDIVVDLLGVSSAIALLVIII